jgi:hypothetical protein
MTEGERIRAAYVEGAVTRVDFLQLGFKWALEYKDMIPETLEGDQRRWFKEGLADGRKHLRLYSKITSDIAAVMPASFWKNYRKSRGLTRINLARDILKLLKEKDA